MQKRDSKSFDTGTFYRGDFDNTENTASTTITATATITASSIDNKIQQTLDNNFLMDRSRNEREIAVGDGKGNGGDGGATSDSNKNDEGNKTAEPQNEVKKSLLLWNFLFVLCFRFYSYSDLNFHRKKI